MVCIFSKFSKPKKPQFESNLRPTNLFFVLSYLVLHPRGRGLKKRVDLIIICKKVYVKLENEVEARPSMMLWVNVSELRRMSLGSVGASLARVGVTVSGLSMRSAE